MIIPKSLYIKNFLSFEEENIEFNNGVTTCIMGRNLTEDNQASNGSGKSAFQTAIEFAYTGNVSRKVTKNKLIRRGYDEAKIVHEAFNSSKNETLRIERLLPRKGSEKVNVFINDKRVEIPTTKDANDWIINYINISKEDISNYFIPNEVNYTSFFNSPDTKKKELISRFSNADIVDDVFSKVQLDIDGKSSDVSSKERELSKLEGRLEQLHEDLETEKNIDFEKQKNDRILSINQSIEKCEKSIVYNGSKLADINASISFLRDNIIDDRKRLLLSLNTHLNDYMASSPDYDDEYKKINDSISDIQKKIDKSDVLEKETAEDIKSVQKDIDSMDLVLSGKIECPNCHHEFNPKSDVTVEEAQKNIKEYKGELQDFMSDVEKIKQLREKYVNEKDSFKSQERELSSKEKEFNKGKRRIERIINLVSESLDRFSTQLSKYDRDLKELKEDDNYNSDLIKKYNEQIEEVKSSKRNDTKQRQIEKNIKEVEESIEDVRESITRLNNEQESIKEWFINFKLFKSYLANKKLKIIQDMINKYLKDMKCDYKLKLEGYKTLANGKDIREKITPYIYQDGEMCDYGEFSKGERTRIDFATLLTLQSLVNDNCESGGLSLLFADEIGEGLDSLGLSLLLNALNETGKTILLTTHVANENIYDNVLMIEKTNGVSRIVN